MIGTAFETGLANLKAIVEKSSIKLLEKTKSCLTSGNRITIVQAADEFG